MVVSAQHFSEVTNGYQKSSSGLWVHKGRQRTLFNPSISNGSYEQAHLELEAQTPAQPMIGFHERDSSALTLYKQQGYQTLRVRQADGVDYPLVGGPGSVTSAMLADGTITSADMAAGASQAVIGSYLGNPSWNTPSAGAYHETPLQVNCTVTSARTFIKLEASLNVYNDTPGQYAQVLFGANGTARNAMAAVMSPSSNWQVPVSIFIYYADPPGAYRYAVFLYVTSGTASIWNGVQSYLVVTEIRR